MPAPTRHPAILVVDDEPDILIILRRLMRDMTNGYDILTASDGVDALSKLEERPVSLVITDYTMPRMNGLQLSTEIKSRSPGTYIVMISAFGLHEAEEARPDAARRLLSSQAVHTGDTRADLAYHAGMIE